MRFGRIATVGGIVVASFTALIASTYDNLMNYLQALFSIFNAPLFATFIIGMFWKRMTPRGRLLGPDRRHVAAAATFLCYKAERDLASARTSPSRCGARASRSSSTRSSPCW